MKISLYRLIELELIRREEEDFNKPPAIELKLWHLVYYHVKRWFK